MQDIRGGLRHECVACLALDPVLSSRQQCEGTHQRQPGWPRMCGWTRAHPNPASYSARYLRQANKKTTAVFSLGAAAPRADWMGFWVSQGTAVPTGRCVFMNVSQCFLRRCCSCTCSDCARDAQTCSRLALPLASTGPRARRTGNAETSATSSRPAAEGILVASPLQTLRGSASGMRSSRQLPAQPSGTQPLVQCPCWPLSRQLAGLSEHTSHLVVSIRRQNKAAAKGGGGRRLTVHPPPIPPPVPATEPAQQRHDSLACHS